MDQSKVVSVVQQMQDYNEQIAADKKYKPRLYTYPDSENSSTVFYEDEMEDLIVLCVKSKCEEEKDKVYVWKSPSFEDNELPEKEFIEMATSNWHRLINEK